MDAFESRSLPSRHSFVPTEAIQVFDWAEEHKLNDPKDRAADLDGGAS